MLSWTNVMACQEHHADLLQEAQQERLARQALARPRRRDRFYRRVLTWLGHHLVTWGWRLQARYGSASANVNPARCQPHMASQ